MLRIESLLSARLFLAPQLVERRLYFVSNLSGRLSLYAMDHGGSVPEPLLPPQIALQNPELVGGHLFYVLPKLGKILVMLDSDGDENYQPMLIPLSGGYPEPAFGERFNNYRVACADCDETRNLVYLSAQPHDGQVSEVYQGNLATGELQQLGASSWSPWPSAVNQQHSQVIMSDGYTTGDHVLYHWQAGRGERQLLYGTPLEQRAEGQQPALNNIFACQFVAEDRGLLFITALFDDSNSLGYLDLAAPAEVRPVRISGILHQGQGELSFLEHLVEQRYMLGFNIDGVSWLYEGEFDHAQLELSLRHVLVGAGALEHGVIEGVHYDKQSDSYALAFCTATSATQIYTIEGADRRTLLQHTRERLLGVDAALLAPGEDASYSSFDGLRISARLYLPARELGFKGPRPLVYYIHGGPQSQERPNFAWFSMPLIQFLTLNGFAVFVPNVRGSSGYGLRYTKYVDRDWGGDDRLDHVHAMQVLAQDPRLDTSRAAVIGRSYGGYMTLTLASRHPELWAAAVDMFGPYDLLSFMDRVPETWKPYFKIAIGDPEADRDFLIERSPRTYIQQISCPLLVIQGRNDPRVIEQESRDVVEQLRALGKQVDYLVFDDEGHDVLKFENRVRCYNSITEFFKQHLRP